MEACEPAEVVDELFGIRQHPPGEGVGREGEDDRRDKTIDLRCRANHGAGGRCRHALASGVVARGEPRVVMGLDSAV